MSTAPKEESKELMNFSEEMPEFLDVIKKRFLEQNADVALKIIAERKKLQKALDWYNKLYERLEKGDVTALEDFKKKRQRLEDEDGYEF